MEQYDVIVLGGGSSGIMAALAAAREGANVLLIERNGVLGGTNVTALVCPLMTFHAEGRQIVSGLAQRVVDELDKRGGTLGHVPDPLGVTETITPIEPSLLKPVYFALARECPTLRVRLHCLLTGARLENGKIVAIQCHDKSGAHEFAARIYIDATGDGDLAAQAGAEYQLGRPQDGLSQPMSLLFKVGGVDFAAIRDEMRAHPDQFVLRKDALEHPYTAVSGFFSQVRAARDQGDLRLDRDRVLMFQGVRPDQAIVNMTRVIKCSGVRADELTSAETEVNRQIDEILRMLPKYIPGCEKAYLLESGVGIGVRESRRVVGQYTLTVEDIYASRVFDDSIACCGFPIDIHDPLGAGLDWRRDNAGGFYDVPYRVMLPGSISNLLVTGRCASATHEAMASLRITATAMAMGEAAGIAAAMAADRNQAPREVDIPALQGRIAARGGIYGRKGLK